MKTLSQTLAMLSILRRSYGVAVVSVSSIIANNNNKFPPLPRFVSSIPLEIPKYDPNAFTIPRDFFNTHIQAVRSFDNMLFGGFSTISDYNFVFETLLKIGSISTVISLFKQLEESLEFNSNTNHHKDDVSPDIHTWAILITCHSRQGNMSKAISLFHKIIDTGHNPTTQNLCDIFEGFSDKRKIQEAMLFYNDIILKNGLGFLLNRHIYRILIHEFCEIGETQSAIQLLRQALLIDKEEPEDYGYRLLCCYNSLIFRLSKDRLVNQAYDLYSEMIQVNNIKPNNFTYQNLIYGHCVLGQFKQAIGLFRELEASRTRSPTPPALVTEEEVKSAKSVATIMIKGGVKPNAASYHSVNEGLFKGKGGMNKIAQKVKMLLHPKYYLNEFD